MTGVPAHLVDLATAAATRLRARADTVAVAESSAGGLVSAALLAVPGASDFYVGGVVVYTPTAFRHLLPAIERPPGLRGATEAFARHLARAVATSLGTAWAVGETGATGPTANPYGDPAGHAWVAVAGPVEVARHVLTGRADRVANMQAFAGAALEALVEALDRS